MGTIYLFRLLFNPISIAFLVLIVAGITQSQLKRNDSQWKPPVRALFKGYIWALLATVPAAYLISYTSPEVAYARFKVEPEHYWRAQLKETLLTYTFAAYAALLGIACIGLRAIIILAKGGNATVPAVVIAAGVLSLAVSGVMSFNSEPPFRHFLALAKELVGGHMLVALAFSLGVGLPWQSAKREA